jgi:hypothetical protein
MSKLRKKVLLILPKSTSQMLYLCFQETNPSSNLFWMSVTKKKKIYKIFTSSSSSALEPPSKWSPLPVCWQNYKTLLLCNLIGQCSHSFTSALVWSLLPSQEPSCVEHLKCSPLWWQSTTPAYCVFPRMKEPRYVSREPYLQYLYGPIN